MGGENVKITILQRLLQSIAPDLCYSCGQIGSSLCQYCKYDISHETISDCFWCGDPSPIGVCDDHNDYIDAVYVAGWYSGGLKAALEGLKFGRDKFCTSTLSEVLADSIPIFDKETVCVPVPTLRANVRRRGYDQAGLLAKGLAARCGLKHRVLIERSGRFVQHDTESRSERELQVKGAFAVLGKDVVPRSVLIVDDIITTGATVNEIARVLKASGVERVFVAAVARTP